MVILFAWLLGGIIGAANRSGGMAALGPLVIGYIKDSFLSQLITFFFGFLIFMDARCGVFLSQTSSTLGLTARAVRAGLRQHAHRGQYHPPDHGHDAPQSRETLLPRRLHLGAHRFHSTRVDVGQLRARPHQPGHQVNRL